MSQNGLELCLMQQIGLVVYVMVQEYNSCVLYATDLIVYINHITNRISSKLHTTDCISYMPHVTDCIRCITNSCQD